MDSTTNKRKETNINWDGVVWTNAYNSFPEPQDLGRRHTRNPVQAVRSVDCVSKTGSPAGVLI